MLAFEYLAAVAAAVPIGAGVLVVAVNATASVCRVGVVTGAVIYAAEQAQAASQGHVDDVDTQSQRGTQALAKRTDG